MIITLGLLLLLIVLSPYTVVKLTTYAEDFNSEVLGEEYVKLEEEYQSLKEQEEQLLQEMSEDSKSAEDSKSNFDSATAPSQVSLELKLEENKKTPDFEIEVEFVGVGRKPIKVEMNEDGKIETTLETGRYYVELVIEDQNYKPENDLPAFFLLPNKEVDLGKIYLVEK